MGLGFFTIGNLCSRLVWTYHMKLILREWPPTPVIDVGINMDALHGAFFRDINDSASQQALKSIHKKYWLLCTCNIKNPAALTVRRINESDYCLVNIQHKGEHKAECPLRYTTMNGQGRLHRPIASKAFDFNIIDENIVGSPLIYDVTNGSTQLPILSRLQECLLTEAGVYNIKADQEFTLNLRALEAVVASGIYVNSVELKERFHFGYRNFFSAKERLNNELSNNELKAPIFLVDIVDEVVKQGSTLKFTKYYKNRKPFEFKLFESLSAVSFNSEIQGPYLVVSQLGLIRDKRGKQVIGPVATIIEPIAGKHHWVPVPSALVRNVINKFIGSLAWYKEKVGLEIVVKMNTSTVRTKLGLCNPLFVISAGSCKVIFDIQADLTSKQQTQKSLEYIVATDIGGGGYCVLTSDMNEREINDKLFHAVARIMKELYRASAGEKDQAFNGEIIEI